MKKQTVNYIIIYTLIALCLGLWVFSFFQIRFADSEDYISVTLQKIDTAKDIALIKIDPNTHINNVIYGTSFAIPVKTILEFINS